MRYFFHVYDEDGMILDKQGEYFLNDDEAKAHAEKIRQELVFDDARYGSVLQLVNERGEELMRVKLQP